MFGFSKTIRFYAEGLFDLNGTWLQKRKQKGRPLTDKSARDRNGIIKNYILPLWGNLAAANLTVKNVDDALIKAVAIKTGKELSGARKNRILVTLSEVCSRCIEEGKLKENIPRQTLRFSQKVTNRRGVITKKDLDALFPDSRDKLLKIWGKQIYVCAFLVLRDTGLRPGELLALTWADWYPDLRFFPVTKAVETGTRNKIKGTKTGAERPAVVTEQTAAEIAILRAESADVSPERFIFADPQNVPFCGHRLTYIFKLGVKRAGINRPEYTPYWLRHTFNTNMLHDLPDELVRILMGHVTEGMTRHYRHADIEMLTAEAKKIKHVLDQRSK